METRQFPAWLLYMTAADQTVSPLAAPELMTAPEVAAFLRVTVRHIQKLVSWGDLKPIRLGRAVRYRRRSVLAALDRLEAR